MGALVDFHAHLLTHTFFDTLATRSPREGSPEEILSQVAAAADIELPSADVGELLGRWIAELDRYGVEHLVAHASVPEEVDAVAEAAAFSGGRLSALVLADPTEDGTNRRVASLVREGVFEGILLLPSLHGFSIGGPEVETLLHALGGARIPVVVHCGLTSTPVRDRFLLPAWRGPVADPLDLVPVAYAHENLRFVIPELGGGLFREALMAGAACENVLVATGSSRAWLATQPVRMQLADAFERAIGVFGVERVLFGTGSSTFPRGWRHDEYTAQREALGACGLSEPESRRILGENAMALLGLSG